MLILMPPVPAPYPFNVATTSHKRPRGLWKGRRVAPHSQSRLSPKAANLSHDFSDGERLGDFYDDRSSYSTPQYEEDDSTSLDADVDDSSSCSSSKRRRISGYFDLFTEHSSTQASSSGSHTPLSDLYNAISPTHRTTLSMSSSTSSKSSQLSISAEGKQPTTTADYEDWENLKELFARAVERYDCASVVAIVYISSAAFAYGTVSSLSL